jgi:hypothetical protein
MLGSFGLTCQGPVERAHVGGGQGDRCRMTPRRLSLAVLEAISNEKEYCK